MVNGPPTPPATTPAELQDAAQSTSVPELSVNVPLQDDTRIRPAIYDRAMLAIGDAIAMKDYQRIIDIVGEIDFVTSNENKISRMIVVAPLVLVHLINDCIPPARYALDRLPESLAPTPLARTLAALVVFATKRLHAQLYDRINMLMNLVTQPDFFDKELGLHLLKLATTFLESFQQRSFDLLSKAYTSLQLSLASTYLGLNVEQTLSVVEQHGWSYDSSSQILYPDRDQVRVAIANKSPQYSSLHTFNVVADSVARLEG